MFPFGFFSDDIFLTSFLCSGCIKALAYSKSTHKLFSTAEDGKLAAWDLDSEREEVCAVCIYVHV